MLSRSSCYNYVFNSKWLVVIMNVKFINIFCQDQSSLYCAVNETFKAFMFHENYDKQADKCSWRIKWCLFVLGIVMWSWHQIIAMYLSSSLLFLWWFRYPRLSTTSFITFSPSWSNYTWFYLLDIQRPNSSGSRWYLLELQYMIYHTSNLFFSECRNLCFLYCINTMTTWQTGSYK